MNKIYNFSELHNSKFVLDAIDKNNQLNQEIGKSEQLIKKYLKDFIETFIFNDKTIDTYLSKNDIKLICKNNKRLSKFWKTNLLMSEIINNFRQSDFYKIIEYQNYEDKSDIKRWEISDFQYKNKEYFIDIINKQIYFINRDKPLNNESKYSLCPRNFFFRLNDNIIKIHIVQNYLHQYRMAVECVYPTLQTEQYSKEITSIKIDLLTNTILKNENDSSS